MDLSFLAFLAVNDGKYEKEEKVSLGDKYRGDKLSMIHVHPTENNPEGVMFFDRSNGKGIFRSWYPDGKDHFIFELKDWKNEGSYYEMYNEGTVKVSGFIKNGKMSGPYFEYHPNGSLKCLKPYNNGEIYGICQYFSDTGVLERIDEHSNTLTFERKTFYPNGILCVHSKFLNGKPIDKHTSYYPNGAVFNIKVYSSDHTLILNRVYKQRNLRH